MSRVLSIFRTNAALEQVDWGTALPNRPAAAPAPPPAPPPAAAERPGGAGAVVARPGRAAVKAAPYVRARRNLNAEQKGLLDAAMNIFDDPARRLEACQWQAGSPLARSPLTVPRPPLAGRRARGRPWAPAPGDAARRARRGRVRCFWMEMRRRGAALGGSPCDTGLDREWLWPGGRFCMRDGQRSAVWTWSAVRQDQARSSPDDPHSGCSSSSRGKSAICVMWM